MIFSSERIQQYKEDGILFPIPALTYQEVSYFRSEFEKVKLLLGEHATPHDMRQPQIHFPWAYEMATHPNILDAIENLIGPNILVGRGTIFFKDPGPGFYTFHQDAFKLGLSKAHAFKFVTAWIALTVSNVENGCMQVVPRSHLDEIQHAESFFKDDHDKNSAVSRGLTASIDINVSQNVNVTLYEGEMSLHHANLVHGSGPNCTTKSRIGVVMRYMAPEVKEKEQLSHPVILARGQDDYCYNEHLQSPPEGSPEECLKACSDYIASHPEGDIYKKQSMTISGQLH